MGELEIKAKLEKALQRQLTQAEWRHLKRIGLVSEYERHSHSWQEFRNLADDQLRWLRNYEEDKIREQTGELEPDTSDGRTPDQLTDVFSSLSDRTFARSRALGTLNLLRTGGSSSGRAAIHGTLLPRGGVDGTLAQWEYIVAVELWVPAEEVMSDYRSMQRTLLSDPKPPQTQERAFDVARFVWENEIAHGQRPSWPELRERWNNWPLTKPFKKNWRDFRTTFLRGARATPPRYVASNEQMTELVRSRSHQGAFDVWASKVRE
jgi:hypothetical protein